MKTALSTGTLLRTLLLQDADITAAVGDKIFPIVATEEAELPYIAYRFGSLMCNSVGAPAASAYDKPTFEITIYAEDYDSGTMLAETVRAALFDARISDSGISLNHFRVTNYSDGWAGDCFYHQLTIQANTNIFTNR